MFGIEGLGRVQNPHVYDVRKIAERFTAEGSQRKSILVASFMYARSVDETGRRLNDY